MFEHLYNKPCQGKVVIDDAMKEKITQTAGREQLGEFAPLFARLNDDVLFGQVWNEGATDIKTKCIITVVALIHRA